MSYSGHFSFSSFFSFARHSSRPKRFISHDPHFQLSCHIPGPTVCIYHFSCCSIFLVIFHYLKSVILIFRDFQYFSPYSRSYSVHLSFFLFFNISCHISVPNECYSHFRDFQFSRHIPGPKMDIYKFSKFFSFPCHISRPKVCIFHFP